MRLTCPNCSARYEVDDSMIPPEGRDVQCSSCATTWFQPGRRTDQPTAVRIARPAHAEMDIPAETAPPPAPPEMPEEDVKPSSEPEPEPVADETPAKEGLRRREIDPAVREILQEEAAREERLHHGTADPVETQTEMTLEETPDADIRARRRAELDEARDAFEADPPVEDSSARRDLLPDIEEINSTLRASDDRSAGEDTASDIDTLHTGPRRRRGVRMGFLVTLIVAGLGVGLYVGSDRIGAALPAAESALDSYTSNVNAARFWLDDAVRSLAGEDEEG